MKENKINNVLFVCLGNTARSPAAEYLAKNLKKKYKDQLLNVNFDSAGFFNAFSYMQPESRNYLRVKDIDFSDFIPKIINNNLLEKQDLILTMEKSQEYEIKQRFSQIDGIKNKVFTLKSFIDEKDDSDIIDPYGTNLTFYNEILKEIEDNVEKVIKKIIKINNHSKKEAL